MKPKKFLFKAEQYEYYQAGKWARAVEIPIFERIIHRELIRTDRHYPMILEVGNVMQNHTDFGPSEHYDVLDLYEHGPGVVNKDATFWRTGANNYSLIISVSTFEHIGQGRYEGADQLFRPMAAALNLFTWCLASHGKMIFSIPLKYRRAGDIMVWNAFPEDWTRTNFLRNCGNGVWEQVSRKEARRIGYYGKPYPGANGLAIVQVQKPPL